MKKNNRAKGFTLVELLVVMAIIGILIAIGMPKMQEVTKQAKLTATEANFRVIKGAIYAYQAANAGALPQTMNDVIDLLEADITGKPAGAKYKYENFKLTASNDVDATKTWEAEFK